VGAYQGGEVDGGESLGEEEGDERGAALVRGWDDAGGVCGAGVFAADFDGDGGAAGASLDGVGWDCVLGGV